VNTLLRSIPKVDDILKERGWKDLVKTCPESLSKDLLRVSMERLRSGIKAGTITALPTIDVMLHELEKEIRAFMSPRIRRVINGTGVIIHTNLGRSLLPDAAVKALVGTAKYYTNLEYDVARGERGDRYEHCLYILRKLTGAESALVVNNNAAAVFLALNTLAEGKEVVISRGELVEIGGSFRIPDVMKKSGVILREVGTTNRTYREDFERVIYEETGLLMKAHPSNFRIKGFVREIEVAELVSLGVQHNIPTYFDAGSGLLFSLKDMGIHDEPTIPEELAKGLDVISFSGDKLPGAPQAGIIIGKKPYIDAMKKNPLARALRTDKFTLAALEATLLLYLDLEKAKRAVPTLRMMHEKGEVLQKRAARLVKSLKEKCSGCSVAVAGLNSEVGGGTLPDVSLPSYGIYLKPDRMSTSRFEERLRGLEIPIIGRIEKDAILLDMRTILKDDEVLLISGIATALKDGE
jgi:L-seryl-tRNA(Ser) seleniumtransferase